MMLHRLAAPFARLSARREARWLGASVRFSRVPKGFFPGFAEGSLSSLWMEQGMPVRGVGIFTVGLPDSEGRTTRYAPDSDAYQGWFGAYLVKAPSEFLELSEGVPNLNNVLQLFIEDRNHWLRRLGDSHPVMFMLPGTETVQEGVPLSSGQGTLIEAAFRTHADTGPGSGGRRARLFCKTVERLFSPLESGVGVPKGFLTVPAACQRPSYETVTLQGFGMVVSDRRLGVTAAAFAAVDERHFPSLREEMLDSILTMRIGQR